MHKSFSSLPLVILHGWTLAQNTRQKWQPLITQLKKIGLKVSFLKIPGLSQPLTKTWTLADYELWLKGQLKDQFETGKFILLGHSFGGQLAASFSAHYPNSIQALILIDSAGIRDKAGLPNLKKRVFRCLAKFGKIIADFFGFEKLGLDRFLRKLLYKIAREKDYLKSPPHLRQTLANILEADIQAELAQIKAPTLIIWGQEDTITPLADAKVFADQINHSQLEIISGPRHSPQYSYPTKISTLVRNFLESLDWG